MQKLKTKISKSKNQQIKNVLKKKTPIELLVQLKYFFKKWTGYFRWTIALIKNQNRPERNKNVEVEWEIIKKCLSVTVIWRTEKSHL